MRLREILGQDVAVKQLRNAVRQERISHGYLFVGPDGSGKRTTALAFAQALNCLDPQDGDSCGQCAACVKLDHGNHPNLQVVEPDGGTIKIQQIRAVQQSAQYRQLDEGWKVFIILEAEKLTLPAANSLLKTLEEPPASTVIILIANHTAGLLPTVLSRCQKISFPPLITAVIRDLLTDRHRVEPAQANFLAALAGGSMAAAKAAADSGQLIRWRDEALEVLAELQSPAGNLFTLAEKLEKEKNRLGTLLETMILWYRDVLIWRETGNQALMINIDKIDDVSAVTLSTNQLVEAVRRLHEAGRHLQQNANTRLTLETLFIELNQIILGGNMYGRSCGHPF